MSSIAESAKADKRQAKKLKASQKEQEANPVAKAGWFAETVVVLLCLAWIVPTLGLFMTSLRPAADANANGWWNAIANPMSLTLGNYKEALLHGSFPMGNAFINSLAVSIPATIIPILIAAFAAYVFTFMEFKGRDLLFIVVVGLLVVPNQVALVPLLLLFTKWGISGNFVGVWIAHTGFGMPLAIYILRNYMATLPKSLVESASIDGASHFQTFWKLIIPISTPALASFAIFQFLWVWNDLLVALIFLGSGDNMVLTQAMASLAGSRNESWHLLTAAGFFSILAPMAVFFSLQRFFVRGMTAGAVKG